MFDAEIGFRLGVCHDVGDTHVRHRVRICKGCTCISVSCNVGTPVVVSGLRGTPHAGDTVRVMASEARARAVSDARSDRARQQYLQRLENLAQDHFEITTDEETGEETKCVTICWC